MEDTEGSNTGDETTADGDSTFYSRGSSLALLVSWWFSSRLALATFAFFGFMSMSSQRVCMDVAITCMVNDTSTHDGKHFLLSESNGTTVAPPTTSPDLAECGVRPRVFPENLTMHPTWEGTFQWSEMKQEVVLGVYYWGYLCSQIPSGWLATKFGGKWVLGCMMLIGSVCTGLVPLAARAHYFTLILVRFVGGFGAGVMFPGMHALWGRWSPPEERSRLASIGFTGAMLGHVVTFPLSAVLCEYGIDGGWPSIFYLLGGLGLIWSIFWILFVNSSPIEHGRISREEREYILETLSGEGMVTTDQYDETPWVTFFGSVPVMVIVLNNFTCAWGFYTFERSVPYFMKTILKYDIKKDPAIAAFPYIGLGFLIFMSGIWADKLRLRGVIQTVIIRKIFQGIGTLIPAALLVSLGFLGCHQAAAAVSILVLAMTFCAFHYNGYVVNHLDIAPKYAGVLIGLSNTVGLTAGLLAPFLRALIVPDETREQWQTWLFITASFYVIGTVCFILGAEGEVLEWAECEEFDRDELSSETETPEPVRKSPKVTMRSKSIPSAHVRRDDGVGSGQQSPRVMPGMSSAPAKRLSVPDLPSELHRQTSKTQSSKKGGASNVDKPNLAAGRTKRSDSDDIESEGSSRSSNPRRQAGDSPNTTVAPNLDSLSESVV